MLPVSLVGGSVWMERWIQEIAAGLEDLEKRRYGYKGA
jgi:hypothetical protein